MSWALCYVLGSTWFNLQNYLHSTNKEPEAGEGKSNWCMDPWVVMNRAGFLPVTLDFPTKNTTRHAAEGDDQ